MSNRPALKPVLHIIGDLLSAGLCTGMAWLFWTAGVGDWALLRLFAAIFAVGALQPLAKGLYGLLRLILRQRSWARFQRQGAAPKADKLASSEDLSARGMFK
ncbi:hypothetical protein SAMN04488118_1155 [Epibacterium ulvae]|uniref:YrhK-like protein n=1 Tax=Epibacterium ulvae TaxID=1156985 RepID=A0A1G5RHE1_9RHOB|nr:hypothetical protein [Epibacterium ulvae]SCZ72669.1 hypothetical protein SAMN04488118_1155 [Epibacterium ulvae]